MSGLPVSRSIRVSTTHHGIACRARAPRQRSPHSSPRPGKPVTWRRGTGRRCVQEGEAREMREAAPILSIIRARGERGLPLQDAYHLLYNPTFYLHAYGRISRNAGALTPGITSETVDG